MHFCAIDKGKIVRYQCVVPTTWNASPKDVDGVNGPMEEAMMGIPYSTAGAKFTAVDGVTEVTTGGGVEALRVAQTFDPCIACAVH
jgi:Ni,Fe-hydrogenase I large subunit